MCDTTVPRRCRKCPFKGDIAAATFDVRTVALHTAAARAAANAALDDPGSNLYKAPLDALANGESDKTRHYARIARVHGVVMLTSPAEIRPVVVDTNGSLGPSFLRYVRNCVSARKLDPSQSSLNSSHVLQSIACHFARARANTIIAYHLKQHLLNQA